MFEISINDRLGDILSSAEPFVANLGMVMQPYGPECHVKRLVCYSQGQGHNEGYYKQI